MNPQSTLIMGSGEPRAELPPATELAVGALVDGKYRIHRKVAQGGMGSVYEAENERIRKRVALKVLLPERGEASAVERFEREAQASGVIGSQHIVEVFDLGVLPSGEHYMVMEYLEGETLRARLARGRLTPAAAYPVARQILDALIFAHRAGIVHRDLKPENVHLAPGPQGLELVKLLDFGISKFTGSGSEGGFSITRTGVLMGTPSYMSPEQARGAKSLDARADIYALGVILYECLAGRVPFSGASFTEILFQIATTEAIPIEVAAPDVDARLAGIVRTAMARDPVARYPSAEQMAAALDAWAGRGPAVAPIAAGAAPLAPMAAWAAPAAPGEREPPTVPTHAQAPGPPVRAPLPGARVGALDATVNVGPGAAVSDADYRLPTRRPGVPLGAIAAVVVVLLVLGGGGVAAAMLLAQRAEDPPPPPAATAPAPTPTVTAAAPTAEAPAADSAGEPAAAVASAGPTPAGTGAGAVPAATAAGAGASPGATATAPRKPTAAAPAGTATAAATATAPRKSGDPPAPAGLKVNQGRLVRTDL